jgi:hypothetical protein
MLFENRQLITRMCLHSRAPRRALTTNRGVYVSTDSDGHLVFISPNMLINQPDRGAIFPAHVIALAFSANNHELLVGLSQTVIGRLACGTGGKGRRTSLSSRLPISQVAVLDAKTGCRLIRRDSEGDIDFRATVEFLGHIPCAWFANTTAEYCNSVSKLSLTDSRGRECREVDLRGRPHACGEGWRLIDEQHYSRVFDERGKHDLGYLPLRPTCVALAPGGDTVAASDGRFPMLCFFEQDTRFTAEMEIANIAHRDRLDRCTMPRWRPTAACIGDLPHFAKFSLCLRASHYALPVLASLEEFVPGCASIYRELLTELESLNMRSWYAAIDRLSNVQEAINPVLEVDHQLGLKAHRAVFCLEYAMYAFRSVSCNGIRELILNVIDGLDAAIESNPFLSPILEQEYWRLRTNADRERWAHDDIRALHFFGFGLPTCS